MDVYISVPRVAQIIDRQQLTIKDISKVYCVSKNIQRKIENLNIFYIPNRKHGNYTISIMEIIEVVLKEKELQDVTISWIGEKNVLIEYLPYNKKMNKFLEYLLVAFVGSVIFFGSMTALMSFQVETDMTSLVDETCKILLGEDLNTVGFVSIPYALGITTGIIVFFNHIGGKKLTTDPTPIEIEMFSFDKQMAETCNEHLELKKNGEKYG